MKNSWGLVLAIVFVATIIETFGSWLNFQAAKLRNAGLEALPLTMLTGALVFYLLGGIAWYKILRITDGNYAGAASVWGCMAAVLSIALAFIVGQKQTTGEWIGFGLIVVGVLVRSLFSS